MIHWATLIAAAHALYVRPRAPMARGECTGWCTYVIQQVVNHIVVLLSKKTAARPVGRAAAKGGIGFVVPGRERPVACVFAVGGTKRRHSGSMHMLWDRFLT